MARPPTPSIAGVLKPFHFRTQNTISLSLLDPAPAHSENAENIRIGNPFLKRKQYNPGVFCVFCALSGTAHNSNCISTHFGS